MEGGLSAEYVDRMPLPIRGWWLERLAKHRQQKNAGPTGPRIESK